MGLLLGMLVLVFDPAWTFAQDDDLYSFDVEEFTKKTWEWKGTVSASGTLKSFNTDSVLYSVKFPDDEPVLSNELNLELSLDSRWDWGWSRFFLIGDANVQKSSIESISPQDTLLREGYWQIFQFEPHSIDIGKRLLRWGKGYAFNPVAFLERAKNPEDPEASREGLWMVQEIWIFEGFSLFSNSSVNLVYLPIREDLNDDYQVLPSNENIWGLKLYALIADSDFDLYYIHKSEQKVANWGVDFATNITSNFEVHGEYAVNGADELTNQILLGLRYLTENDLTWIIEGYHNSAGLEEDESKRLFNSIQSSSAFIAKQALSIIQQSRTLNQNYGYIKASIKEPFNWLYFTPSVSLLANLDDSSQNMNLQCVYVPDTNWMFELSWQYLNGDKATQYGENPVKDKTVLEVTYSF